MKKETLILVGVALVVVAVGVAVFLSSRGNVPNSSSAITNTQPPAVMVPFTEIAHGSKSTVATRVNYFITSVDELKKLWAMVDAPGAPPSVDFKKQAVLAVFAGKEPGSTIAVAKIEDANARTVSIAITKPDGTCKKKPSTVSPYEIVAVSATSLPLTHEDVQTSASCSE